MESTGNEPQAQRPESETAYLLRSPRNAERLLAALRRAEAREGKPEGVEDLESSLGL